VEEQLLCQLPSQSASSTYPMCVIYSCTMASFTSLPSFPQKLSSSDGECMFGSMFTFRLSVCIMAVKLLLPLVFRLPLFSIIFYPKFFSIPFLYVFGLTVPQQLLSQYVKRQNIAGDVSHMFNPCSKSCYSCVCSCEGGICAFPVFPKCTVIS